MVPKDDSIWMIEGYFTKEKNLTKTTKQESWTKSSTIRIYKEKYLKNKYK